MNPRIFVRISAIIGSRGCTMGDSVVALHVVVEVEARCVDWYVSQHVGVLWFVINTDGAGVAHLVGVVRLVDRW